MSAERSIALSALFLLIVVATAPADDSITSWQQTELANGEPPVTLSPDSCDCCAPPSLQFTADLLVLGRGGPDDRGLLYDSASGAELLRTGDLGMSAEAGLRLGVICFDESGWDLELGYLGTDRFASRRTRDSDSPVVFPFFDGVPLNPSEAYSVDYASRLRSGEFNVRHRMHERVSLLAGFRVLELKEKFDITDGSGGFFSSTDNDLYGLQIGGDLILWTIRRSHLFGTLKSGVYYNNADVMVTASSSRGQLLQFIDDEDVAAFAGDVAVGLLIPMGPRADLRLGYQGIYLDGVGLAPDQSDNYSIFTRSGSLDQSTLFYHGGFLGIDFFF